MLTNLGRIITLAAVLGLAAHAHAEDAVTGPAAGQSKIAYCGQQWKAAKSDATVKSAGWPAYWHLCSVKLKQAKQ